MFPLLPAHLLHVGAPASVLSNPAAVDTHHSHSGLKGCEISHWVKRCMFASTAEKMDSYLRHWFPLCITGNEAKSKSPVVDAHSHQTSGCSSRLVWQCWEKSSSGQSINWTMSSNASGMMGYLISIRPLKYSLICVVWLYRLLSERWQHFDSQISLRSDKSTSLRGF